MTRDAAVTAAHGVAADAAYQRAVAAAHPGVARDLHLEAALEARTFLRGGS